MKKGGARSSHTATAPPLYQAYVGHRFAWKPFCEILVVPIDPEDGVYRVVRMD